jgi:hypothetical protein
MSPHGRGTIVAAVVASCAAFISACGTGNHRATLDPADFTTDITNQWYPLKPGTRWTYREVEDGKTLRVVVTSTSVTRKVASGVTARVVRDTVSRGGQVLEDTKDWYAQASDGTVWYLGEDTAEFKKGKVATRAGSFEAGVDGAEAGIIMPADPLAGQSYRQEYLKGEAEDRGKILAFGKRAHVPAGTYEGLLQTADTTPLEPDVREIKYYAKGVGLVLTVDRKAGEREELLSVGHVSSAESHRAGTVGLGKSY